MPIVVKWDNNGIPPHSITMAFLPVFVPPVRIHAPVVFEALRRPLRKTLLSLGWRSKLAMPPCTEMRSLGSSRHQCFCRSWRIISGLVSWATRTYCKRIIMYYQEIYTRRTPRYVLSGYYEDFWIQVF